MIFRQISILWKLWLAVLLAGSVAYHALPRVEFRPLTFVSHWRTFHQRRVTFDFIVRDTLIDSATMQLTITDGDRLVFAEGYLGSYYGDIELSVSELNGVVIVASGSSPRDIIVAYDADARTFYPSAYGPGHTKRCEDLLAKLNRDGADYRFREWGRWLRGED